MMKNGYDITKALEEKKAHGGSVFLPAGEYPVESPVLVNTPSTGIKGEIWAYNLDPNGVFETRFGSKLKLRGTEHPAISVGADGLPAGTVISDIGIQGDIVGMDTRGLFDMSRPYASAGLYFGKERVDQGDFHKISCCGLAAAVSMAEDSEIDACDFRKINADGCCVGVYFAPRASYYARFHRCIIADNPSYGFFADGTRGYIGNATISETHFVRNCGDNHIKTEVQASVYLKGVESFIFRDNLVDMAGEFWYFGPEATQNGQQQRINHPVIGLCLEGDGNRIFNNVFSRSSRESVYVKGCGNILLGNIADRDVIIEGEGNTVNGLCFTGAEARLVLRGAAADTTVVLGVEESRIVRLP